MVRGSDALCILRHRYSAGCVAYPPVTTEPLAPQARGLLLGRRSGGVSPQRQPPQRQPPSKERAACGTVDQAPATTRVRRSCPERATSISTGTYGSRRPRQNKQDQVGTPLERPSSSRDGGRSDACARSGWMRGSSPCMTLIKYRAVIAERDPAGGRLHDVEPQRLAVAFIRSEHRARGGFPGDPSGRCELEGPRWVSLPLDPPCSLRSAPIRLMGAARVRLRSFPAICFRRACRTNAPPLHVWTSAPDQVEPTFPIARWRMEAGATREPAMNQETRTV
jgi:hypothetical protein